MNEIGLSSVEEITYFLQVLDPFNTQKITFSEIVQLLSSHEVIDDDQLNEQDSAITNKDSQNLKKIPFLEKLSRLTTNE